MRTLWITLIGVLSISAVLLATASDTRVADAAMQGDRELVRTLLKTGADVNAAHGDGMSALHWAAYKDDAEMVQTLIYAGANIAAVTRINAMTPLFVAAQNGSANVIDVLLKAGSNPNAVLTTGATPLMFAARSGSAAAVKALLEKGADANAKEKGRGETALMFAAASNRPAAIKELLAHGANPSIASTVVDIAAKTGVPAGAGNRRGAPPAVAATSTVGPRGAAAAGAVAPEAPRGAAAAAPAAAAGRGGAGAGAPPANMDDERPSKIEFMGGLTPLLLAARQGHVEAVQSLIEGGTKVNEVSPGDKTSPLLIATINGHYDVAKLLLEKGADPRLASTAGATPLYATLNVKWAPKTDYPQPDVRQEKTSYLDLLTALLDKGADPNARLKNELWYSGYNFELTSADAAGATALWRAAQAADVPAMRLLLARGADPKLKAANGVSILHVASGAGVHGNDEVTATGSWMPGLAFVVNELKGDVNEADDKGFTALHHAASRGDNDMILFLVAKGARADTVARNGQTVVDLANGPRQRIQPFHETIALLMALGSQNSHKCVSC